MSEEVQVELAPDQIVEEEVAEHEVVLPSDKEVFNMPDKFKGKSAEDIAKSYLELEKIRVQPKQEAPKEDTPADVPTTVEQEQYEKYATSLDTNGSLSEAEYAELAKAGYSKEVVDAEIQSRADKLEFNKYREEKALNKILEPLGGGTEKFKEVAMWTKENKTAEEVAAINDALSKSTPLAQQALLKSLYAEYEAGGNTDTVLHTNNVQTTPSKGYATETEFFADIKSPAYKTDKSYVKAVEAKLARSNTKDWSF